MQRIRFGADTISLCQYGYKMSLYPLEAGAVDERQDDHYQCGQYSKHVAKASCKVMPNIQACVT